jgi:septation ring formation regulator EzrA
LKYLIIFILFLSCDFSKQDKKNTDSTLPDQNSTLLGIDSDKDGIRDDVQAWINTKYQNQPAVKQAANQFAKALQNGIANKDNVSSSIAATYKKLDADTCLYETLVERGATDKQATAVSEKLELMHSNTKERILAAQKQSQNFSGNSFKIKSKEEACNF